MISASHTSAELAIARIRELSKAQRYAEALAAAETLAGTLPFQRDVLYLIATNQRCLQRIPQALASLEHLERRHPHFALLHQERGYCLVSARETARAIAAFQTAVGLNPLLFASWNMLERLHRATGDTDQAAMAASQMGLFSRLSPEVMQRVSTLAHQRDVPGEAERLLAEILELAPELSVARREYIRVLIDQQKYPPAREQILALAPAEALQPDARLLWAVTSAGIGDYTEAILLYRQLLANNPGRAELLLPLAHCLQACGRAQEAIELYQAAAQTESGRADAWWSLANLKTYRFSAAELAGMQTVEAAPATRPVDRYTLCFALGKAWEDRGEYAQSWAWYERGNRLRQEHGAWHPEHLDTNIRQQVALCTPRFFAARGGWGAPDADPIFIVGLPRSGSTLVEQILASHSEIEGTLELSDIPRLVAELHGPRSDPDAPRYPRVLADLTGRDFHALGRRYLDGTRIYRHGKRRYFIDKMPNNFRHIGLIHLALPNARIIDVRREPLACCVSNFKQLFAAGQEFSYDLRHLAHYYRAYLELMEHWDRVLPGRIFRIHYEDLVADPEGSIRRLLEHCGVGFEPACLEFHQTRRNIGTPSSEQVRQPIFRSGLDRWRHYAPWLGPLEEALGPALRRYRGGS
jgi:tetratricopeptide (TPR) repeat protein